MSDSTSPSLTQHSFARLERPVPIERAHAHRSANAPAPAFAAPPPPAIPLANKVTTPFYFGMHKAQKANKGAPEWSVHCTLVIQYERRSHTLPCLCCCGQNKGPTLTNGRRPFEPFLQRSPQVNECI